MNGDPPTNTAAYIDLFASEYGWTIEYIMDIPNDQAEELVHAIASRKGIKCHRKRLVVEEDHQPLTEKLEAIFGRIDTDN